MPMRIARRKHNKNKADFRVSTQRCQRVINHWLASQRHILLGQFAVHAGAKTCGGDECVEFGHGRIVIETLTLCLCDSCGQRLR